MLSEDDLDRALALPVEEREEWGRAVFLQKLQEGDSLRDLCVFYLMVAYPALPAVAKGWTEVGAELVLDAGSIELRCRPALGPRPLDAPPWQWGAGFVTHDERVPFAVGYAMDQEDAKERAILAARLRVIYALPFML